jgi:C1A family cysteine protease
MKHQQFVSVVLMGLMLSTGALAGSVKVTGTIPATVQVNAGTSLKNSASVLVAVQPKKISLMQIELSPDAKNYLATHADTPVNAMRLATEASSSLPASSLLGMNNVPVLDQGQHGTCATFADTAALDAAHGHTDYISQLCNLELGSYLEEEARSKGESYPSGWDGSLNEIVLQQIQDYGIITTAYQHQYGCGSTRLLNDYPGNDEQEMGTPISTADFSKHSDQIMKDISWKFLLNSDDAYTPKANMEKVLNNVKQALANGHRVVFGTLLDVNGELGRVNGADGTYHNRKNSAWILTSAIRSDLKAKKIRAGHAMVITGYDDNAEITGSDGSKHQGVLTLRNSWSEYAGDKGDYFMSYDYFKLLAMEAEEISPTPFN